MGSIAILGPGAVGGFLAGALWRSGAAPLLVGREATVAQIARSGLEIHSVALGDFNARPAVAPTLDERVDVLIVATKFSGLAQALDRIEADPLTIVPLLNGLDHQQLLRERFPRGVVAGAIRIEADRSAPGVIAQTSPTVRIDLCGADPAQRPRLAWLTEVLEAAGLSVLARDSEADVLWGKLVRLNALALTTSALDRPLGQIRSTPSLRALLEGCVGETAMVAAADGANVTATAIMRELDDAHAGLGSSMRRDIAAGIVPELDAIAGAVLRAAARHRLSCPTVADLAGRVARRAGIAPPA